jgi:cytochrome c-type biogenesis protein CcmH
MNRWLLPIGFGLLLALVALVVVGALGSAERTPGERADALAAELRCPDCQGLSVADSPTRSAQEIRRQIDDLVATGATDDEIRAHFTDRYGEWIRLAPSAPVLWLVPFAVVLAGAIGLFLWLRVRRSPETEARPAISDEERRRLRREMEALDG